MKLHLLVFSSPLDEKNPIVEINNKKKALGFIADYGVKIGNHKPNINTNIHNCRNALAIVGDLLRNAEYAFHPDAGDYDKESFEENLNELEKIWYNLNS